MTQPIRHGDILIRPRTSPIPDEARKLRRQKGRLILAEGEVTGHAHAILDKGASLHELITPGDVTEMRERFLVVEAEVDLLHEEHATLTIAPHEYGYDVIRQVEYAPEELRTVAD